MIKIKSLIDNIACDTRFVTEHGLSFFVEYKGLNIMLDTGLSGQFALNAKMLEVDIASVDMLVISHNHYDHIGGLKHFTELNTKAKIYISSQVYGLFYAITEEQEKYIGGNNEFLRSLASRVVYIESSYELSEGVYLHHNTVSDEHFRCKDLRLQEKTDKGFIADSFAHEMFMVLEGECGELHLLSSCSHNGIVNIIRSVNELYPQKKVKTIVGGFHLKGLSTTSSGVQFIHETASLLLELCSGTIYTCHCTGEPEYALIAEMYGDRFRYFATGDSIVI